MDHLLQWKEIASWAVHFPRWLEDPYMYGSSPSVTGGYVSFGGSSSPSMVGGYAQFVSQTNGSEGMCCVVHHLRWKDDMSCPVSFSLVSRSSVSFLRYLVIANLWILKSRSDLRSRFCKDENDTE
uniref:Uncharacterized protein n=1 Tax=Tanacetum cinerariifolium TaxID=118510 RepID=A0A699JUY7_TANCI|nr:hypothetical protein [Tanacetum cinerariifolium]